MAIFDWLSLANGQVVAFDPLLDKLVFNASAISAAGVSFEFTASTSTFSYGGKTVTLQSAPGTLTTTNVSFQNGSLFLFGDNATTTAGDSLANTLAGGGRSDQLNGSAGNDTLNGAGGHDVLIGDAGNDRLNGGPGNDTMIGGTGNDIYIVNSAGDSVSEAGGSGVDTVRSSVTFTLGDGLENLVLTGAGIINGTGNALANTLTGNAKGNILDGGDGNDRLIGSGGNDTLIGGAGDDRLDGGAGNDSMMGGAGNDFYIVNAVGDIVSEAGGSGVDTVQSSVTFILGDGLEKLQLVGAGNINGTGNSLDNVVTGNKGNNVLDGMGGADTLSGGLGNDTYVVDALGGLVNEGANRGTDTVMASITYTLRPNVENLVLIGGGAINGAGNGLNNELTGNGANNVLNGGAGNDTLDGGVGDDTLIGGADDDTYVVDATGDVVTEGADQGADTVMASVTYTLGANVENLVLIDAGAINATGNELDNVLTGNAANNRLNGDAGNDTLIGGAGNDTYVVDAAGDVVMEEAGQGTDTVKASATYTLSANVENLVLFGAGAINGTGNELDNVLTGNEANNTLDGGAGNDTLIGDAGDDTYVVDAAGDVVMEEAGQGTDTVMASVTYTLGANVENLMLVGAEAINGTGNGLNNELTGNGANNILEGGTGNDTLDGGAGNDTMIGGADNDIYVVGQPGDVVTELDNQGTDTVMSSASNYTLSANVENLVLIGAGNINGFGNALDNVLTGNGAKNNLVGNAGNDTLYGGADNDSLVGDAPTAAGVPDNSLVGDDFLDGGAGVDTMRGGPGSDTYVVDDVSDLVVEGNTVGVDTVLASVSYTLAPNVENLILTGAEAIDGTGNGLANVVTGNSNDNVLNGRPGADTLNGLDGNDTLIWDPDDILVDGGAGTDVLRVIGAGTGTTLTLTGLAGSKIVNVEVINLTGSGSNTLNLSVQNVLDISSTTDTLQVDGKSGDTVHRGSGWTTGADQIIGVETYHTYTQGLATLLVDTDITNVV